MAQRLVKLYFVGRTQESALDGLYVYRMRHEAERAQQALGEDYKIFVTSVLIEPFEPLHVRELR